MDDRVLSHRALGLTAGAIGGMTNVMTWLWSARCACGQPWEAHERRCPRPKHQGVGRVVALAVAGGIALQILFVVMLLFAAGLTSSRISTAAISPPTAGPVQPRVQACELFYAWEKTHNPSLLDRAVADAYSSRVRWQFAPRFKADLSGLRKSTRKSAHSPTANQLRARRAGQLQTDQGRPGLAASARVQKGYCPVQPTQYCDGTVGGLQRAGCSRPKSWRGLIRRDR